jgi:CPA1 family monovalent cation:H+ antiporter
MQKGKIGMLDMLKSSRCRVIFFGLACILLVTMVSSCGILHINQSGIPLLRAETGATESTNPAVEEIIRLEVIIIGLLLLSSLIGIVTQWLRIPYTVGLVLVGLGLAISGQVPTVSVTPEIILALLVPPLIYEAAFHIDFSDLKNDLWLIITLAIPGVILTTFLVGGVITLGTDIELKFALVFGALIAATDPVAVVAIFRSIGAPKRLQLLLEGESLFNDGTAIAVFNLVVGIALAGQFNIRSSLVSFLVTSGGGILVGLILAYIFSRLIVRLNEHLIETILTTILAYSSYLIAEELLGVSGVLAVVAAGLASGNITPRGMSPTTKIVVFNFWEFATFLANSFVFLLIGLQVNISLLINNIVPILWAILAVLFARAVSTFGLSWIGKGIPIKWKGVLFWSGLRGAISLALALGIPSNMGNRDTILAMSFGVVLFSILVEGLSMGPLVKRLGIIQKSEKVNEFEQKHARTVALRSAEKQLREMYEDGLVSYYTWENLQQHINDCNEVLKNEIRETIQDSPELEKEEMKSAWRDALRVQRNTFYQLYRENLLSESNYSKLIAEIDAGLEKPEEMVPCLMEENEPQASEEQMKESSVIEKEDSDPPNKQDNQ